MLRSTQDYLDVFARFKQKENIEAVERLLSTQTHPFESFERSQLGKWASTRRIRQPTSLHIIGTLCCETAEEAKTLVPSLANKIADQDLQDLLDEITKLRTFVD
jgi:DNA-directed RNA polymerase II subunit RPB4